MEKDLQPQLAESMQYIYRISIVVIAATWLYHGIVPKILFMETGELPMMEAMGWFKGFAPAAVYTIGAGEILFGLAFLFFGRLKLLHYLNIFGLLALGIGAAIAQPSVYTMPFNPATTSFGVIGLSMIVLRIMKYLPSK